MTANLRSKFNITQPNDPSNVMRRVQVGTYEGKAMEVVTGFDMHDDRFTVHVYMVSSDGSKTKLELGSLYGAGEREAFAAGWDAVDHWFNG